MKEFFTRELTPKEREDLNGSDRLQFMHDGTEVVFFYPGPGQLAALLQLSSQVRAKGSDNVDPQVLLAYIELFFGLMDAPSQRYFRTRLLDRTDPFELDSEGGVNEILNALIEDWTAGRPTKESRGSQPSRRATGKGSTATTRAKASTSSPSRSRASSR